MEEEKKFDHPRSTAKRLTAYSSQPMANSPSKLQRQTSKGNSPSKLQR